MKKTTYLLIVLTLALSANAGTVLFSDDFESGNLDKWTIGGRQEGTNLAEVTSGASSLVAHLYQAGFSEITIEKKFDYDSGLNFAFDMDVDIQSSASSTSSHYAGGWAEFTFCNESEEAIGQVRYLSSTSSWPFDAYNPNPWHHSFSIPEETGLVSYDLNVLDLLSNITLDMGALSSVKVIFRAYTSSNNYSMSTNTYVDNVVVTPEPTTIVLLSIGSVYILKRCNQRN